jgi:hypothetical protein
MSDFLANLAERSAGRAAVVEPRVPSLFEPVAAVGSVFGGMAARPPMSRNEALLEEIAVEIEAPVTQTAEAPPRQPRKATAPRRDSLDLQESPVEREDPMPEESPASTPRRSVPPRSRAVQAESASDWDEPTEHETVREVTAPPRVERVVETVRERVERMTSPVERRPNEPVREPVVAPTASRVDATPRVEPVRAEVKKTASTGIARPPAPPVEPSRARTDVTERPKALAPLPQVPILPRVERPRPELAPRPIARRAPEPVIQVSIGRIEIRANAPAAAGTRPRTESPVMSLNDYLERTNKRGRA